MSYSTLFLIQTIELKPGGAEETVTIHNLDEYIERSGHEDLIYLSFIKIFSRTIEWVFMKGVRLQLESLRQGFNSVFPMEKLGSFTPAEVQRMLCGDQDPIFTKDEIMKYTEPKLGYTKESPGFLKFVNVLVGMSGSERKAFLQFTTGCSSLPPGGLANLHPR